MHSMRLGAARAGPSAATTSALQLLASVARAGRFALTVRLLTGAPKANAAALFDQLAAAATEPDAAAEVARVRKLYAS